MSRLIEIALDPSRPNANDRRWLKDHADSFSGVVVRITLGAVALLFAGQIFRAVIS